MLSQCVQFFVFSLASPSFWLKWKTVGRIMCDFKTNEVTVTMVFHVRIYVKINVSFAFVHTHGQITYYMSVRAHGIIPASVIFLGRWKTEKDGGGFFCLHHLLLLLLLHWHRWLMTFECIQIISVDFFVVSFSFAPIHVWASLCWPLLSLNCRPSCLFHWKTSTIPPPDLLQCVHLYKYAILVDIICHVICNQ